MTLLDPRRQKKLEQFILKLGLSESVSVDWSLLHLALTHATISSTENYERLEFMGDAVVKLAAAEFLLDTYPTSTAGNMTAIRSILVSDRTLAEIANSYNLGRYLLMGNSALGDRAGQTSRLAASFEAVLAALYLSTHDLTLIHPWLDSHFQERSEQIRHDPAFFNYKGALQELTNAHYKQLPDYRVTETGQDYGDPQRFSAEVWINGMCWGHGSGPSKKAAEQAAAEVAFLKLRAQSDSSNLSNA